MNQHAIGSQVGHEAGKAAWPDDDCIRSMCVSHETWGRATGTLTRAMMSNALTPIKPWTIFGDMGSVDHDIFEIILHRCTLLLGFLLPKPDRFSISALLRSMLRMPVRLMLRLMRLILILQCGPSPRSGI